MSSQEMFFSLSSLERFAQDFALRATVFPEGGRVFFLSGEVGTGKTTFSRFFSEAILGTDANISSPTFSYFHEYGKGKEKILHFDFYRAQKEKIPDLLAILEERDPSSFLLLEWAPEEVFSMFRDIPSISLSFSHGKTADEARMLQYSFSNPLSISPSEARKMWEEYKTPLHVRQHIEKVRQVAVFCARKLVASGIPIDENLVEAGAILHDAVRYVDFPSIEPLLQQEKNASEETISLWNSLREKYKKVHHGDAIGEILESRGFFATAKITRSHNTMALYRKEPFSWEEKIVYYADKRALHENIVSLQDRLEDGQRRYFHEKTTALEEKITKLETEIFTLGKINPEEIFCISASI